MPQSFTKDSSCQTCPLKPQPFVPWWQPTNPQFPVLLVGQAPGQIETVTGIPFTGPAGKMLWRLLKEAGLDKNRLYITNVVKCFPPNDRKPTEEEINCCLERLKAEILLCKPELIIAFGEVASQVLIGKANIRSIRGQFFELPSSWGHPCHVLCCLHPSFVMRQRQWIEIAINDLRKVVDWFTGRVQVQSGEPTFIFDPTPSQLAEQLEQWSKGVVTFDIETPGELNPRKAEIIAIGFCGEPNKAVSLDLHKGHPAWQVVKNFLEDPQVKKCAQNASFDTACLETSGVTVQGLWFDTRLAEHILSSDLPTSLDFLRSKYTDIPPYKPDKKKKDHIGNWSKQDRLTYNCLDALTTWRVAQAQMGLLDEGQWKILQEMLIPAIFVVNKMERKGMLVDTARLALLYKQILPEIEKIRDEVFAPLGINPASPAQLKQYFGIEDTNEDTLLAYIKKGHPHKGLMEQVLKFRRLHKIASVYLLGVYERLEEGRIHTHFKLEGTDTGRLSSENPNLQNVPKEARIIYIADEGKVLVEGDYNQLELRVAAVITGEQLLLQELAEGKNVHHLMGQLIFNKDWSQLTIQQRLQVKGVVFGTLYGRSPRSIAIEYEIPTHVAEQWQATCVTKYPRFLAYRQKQTEIVRATGRCYSPFGRSKIVQNLPQAFNMPIQSAASDITLTSLIELDKAGIDLRITVHDSIVAEFDEKEWQDGVREMKRIMERPIPQLGNHCFPAKFGVGPNWYELEEVKL